MDNAAAPRGAASAASRAASPLVIGSGLALLGHAVLVLAGVVEAASWVPIVECVAACVIGLSHLRRVCEAPAVSAGPAREEGGALVPARLAAPAQPGEGAARTPS